MPLVSSLGFAPDAKPRSPACARRQKWSCINANDIENGKRRNDVAFLPMTLGLWIFSVSRRAIGILITVPAVSKAYRARLATAAYRHYLMRDFNIDLIVSGGGYGKNEEST